MRRLKYSDHWISLSLFVISIFGVVMIGSASAGSAGEYGGTYALENMIADDQGHAYHRFDLDGRLFGFSERFGVQGMDPFTFWYVDSAF